MSTIVDTSYSRYLVGVATVAVGVVFAMLAGEDRLRTPWTWMNYSYGLIFLWVLSLVSAAVAWDQVVRRARKASISESDVSTFDFWIVALLLANVAAIASFYLGHMPVVTIVLFLLALGVTGVVLYLCSEWAPVRTALTRRERVYPLVAFGLHAVLVGLFILYTLFAFNAATSPIIRYYGSRRAPMVGSMHSESTVCTGCTGAGCSACTTKAVDYVEHSVGGVDGEVESVKTVTKKTVSASPRKTVSTRKTTKRKGANPRRR